MQEPLFDDILGVDDALFDDLLPPGANGVLPMHDEDDDDGDDAVLPLKRVEPSDYAREEVMRGLQRGGSRLNRWAGSFIGAIAEGARSLRPIGVEGLSRQDDGIEGLLAQFLGGKETLPNVVATDGRQLTYADGTPEQQLFQMYEGALGRGEDLYAFSKTAPVQAFQRKHKLAVKRFDVFGHGDGKLNMGLPNITLFPGMTDTFETFGEAAGAGINKVLGTQFFGNTENARRLGQELAETFEIWTPEGRERFVRQLDEDPGGVLSNAAMLVMLKGKAAGLGGAAALKAGRVIGNKNVARTGIGLRRLDRVLNEGFQVPGIEVRPDLVGQNFLTYRDRVGRLRSRFGVVDYLDPEGWGETGVAELTGRGITGALSPFRDEFEPSFRERLQRLGLDASRSPEALLSRSQRVAQIVGQREVEGHQRTIDELELAVSGLEGEIQKTLSGVHESGDIRQAGRELEGAYQAFVSRIRAAATQGYDRDTPERRDFIMSLRNTYDVMYGDKGIVSESKGLEPSIGTSDFASNPVLTGFDETMQRIADTGEAGLDEAFLAGQEQGEARLRGGEQKGAAIDLGSVNVSNREGQARRVAFSPTWVSYAMEYEAVPVDRVVASHTVDGAENPLFAALVERVAPGGTLQTRQFNRRMVHKIASNLRPEALLLDLKMTSVGAPITVPVEHEGQTYHLVLAGNNRVEALGLARAQYPGDWELYQRELSAVLPDYGIDAVGVAEMDSPVLVRRLLDSEGIDLEAFAAETNVEATRRQATGEQATKDALTLDSEVLERLNFNLEGQIGDILQDASNQDALRGWLGALEAESGDLYVETTDVSDGGTRTELTKQGMERLVNALFRRVFNSDAGLRMLDLFETVQNSGIKNIERAVNGAFASVAAVELGVRKGDFGESYAIADALATAVVGAWELIRQGATAGRGMHESIQSFLATAEMPGVVALVSGISRELLEVLDVAIDTPTLLSDWMGDYKRLVAQQISGDSLFGDGDNLSQEAMVYQLKERYVSGEPVLQHLPPPRGSEHMTDDVETYEEIKADGYLRGGLRLDKADPRVWFSAGGFYRSKYTFGSNYGFVLSPDVLFEKYAAIPSLDNFEVGRAAPRLPEEFYYNYGRILTELDDVERDAWNRFKKTDEWWKIDEAVLGEFVRADSDVQRVQQELIDIHKDIQEWMKGRGLTLASVMEASLRRDTSNEMFAIGPVDLRDAAAVVEEGEFRVITEETRGKPPSEWELRAPREDELLAESGMFSELSDLRLQAPSPEGQGRRLPAPARPVPTGDDSQLDAAKRAIVDEALSKAQQNKFVDVELGQMWTSGDMKVFPKNDNLIIDKGSERVTLHVDSELFGKVNSQLEGNHRLGNELIAEMLRNATIAVKLPGAENRKFFREIPADLKAEWDAAPDIFYVNQWGLEDEGASPSVRGMATYAELLEEFQVPRNRQEAYVVRGSVGSKNDWNWKVEEILGRLLDDVMRGDIDLLRAERLSEAEREEHVRGVVDVSLQPGEWMDLIRKKYEAEAEYAKRVFDAPDADAAIEKWKPFVAENFFTDADIEKREVEVRVQLDNKVAIDIKGRDVTGHREIAVLAQSLRDAGQEYSTVFYVRENEDGRFHILGHEVTTLGSPVTTGGRSFDEIIEQGDSYGKETKFIFLHNHPSAPAEFSDADLEVIGRWSGRLGDRYLGDIIIDSGTYAYLWNKDGELSVNENMPLTEAELGWEPNWKGEIAGVELGHAYLRRNDPLYRDTDVRSEAGIKWMGLGLHREFLMPREKVVSGLVKFGKSFQTDRNWVTFAFTGPWLRLNALVQARDVHRLPKRERARWLRELARKYKAAAVHVFVGQGDWFQDREEVFVFFRNINDDALGGGILSVRVGDDEWGWMNSEPDFHKRAWRHQHPPDVVSSRYVVSPDASNNLNDDSQLDTAKRAIVDEALSIAQQFEFEEENYGVQWGAGDITIHVMSDRLIIYKGSAGAYKHVTLDVDSTLHSKVDWRKLKDDGRLGQRLGNRLLASMLRKGTVVENLHGTENIKYYGKISADLKAEWDAAPDIFYLEDWMLTDGEPYPWVHGHETYEELLEAFQAGEPKREKDIHDVYVVRGSVGSKGRLDWEVGEILGAIARNNVWRDMHFRRMERLSTAEREEHVRGVVDVSLQPGEWMDLIRRKYEWDVEYAKRMFDAPDADAAIEKWKPFVAENFLSDADIEKREVEVRVQLDNKVAIDIKGRDVAGHREIAVLAQSLRDAGQEYSTVFYVRENEDGSFHILGHEVATLGSPVTTSGRSFNGIIEQGDSYGKETKFIFLHNHPSASARFSDGDKESMPLRVNRLGDRYLGDIVIDSGTYAYSWREDGEMVMDEEVPLTEAELGWAPDWGAITENELGQEQIRFNDPLYRDTGVRSEAGEAWSWLELNDAARLPRSKLLSSLVAFGKSFQTDRNWVTFAFTSSWSRLNALVQARDVHRLPKLHRGRWLRELARKYKSAAVHVFVGQGDWFQDREEEAFEFFREINEDVFGGGILSVRVGNNKTGWLNSEPDFYNRAWRHHGAVDVVSSRYDVGRGYADVPPRAERRVSPPDDGQPSRRARRADVDWTLHRTPYTYGNAEDFSTALRRKIDALERSETSNPQELRWYKKLRGALEADMTASLRAHRPDLSDKIDAVDLAYAEGMTKLNSAYAKHIRKNMGSDLVEGTGNYREMVMGLLEPGMDVSAVGLVYELIGGFNSEAGRRLRRVFLDELFQRAQSPAGRQEGSKRSRGDDTVLKSWERLSPRGLSSALGAWQKKAGQYPAELLEAILGKETVARLYDLDSLSLQFERLVRKLGGSQTAPWLQEWLRSDYRAERLWHTLRHFAHVFGGAGVATGSAGAMMGAGNLMAAGLGIATFLAAWLGTGAFNILMEYLKDKPIGRRYLLEGTVASMSHVLTGDAIFAGAEQHREHLDKVARGEGVPRASVRQLRRLGRGKRDEDKEASNRLAEE